MKKILLTLLKVSFILIVTGQTKTEQAFLRCLTMEALEKQLANNPDYKAYYNKVYNSKNYKTTQLPPLQPVIIPVAFHFSANVTNCAQEACLIDEVDDQLRLLNEAFADNSSSNLINVCPAAYQDNNGSSVVSTGTNISFCYATPPLGNAQGLDPYCDLPITLGTFDGGTFVSEGVGAPDWNGILNIFITNGNCLGVADGIPGRAIADGVTVCAEAFGGIDGTTCNLGANQTFNLGKTLVHEIGHYLGLFHTFQGSCNDEPDSPGPYNVDDTPPQFKDTMGCPAGCIISCDGQATGTANFMDYSNDVCLGLFSKDQAMVMNFWANKLFGAVQYNCGNQTIGSLNTICNTNNCNIVCPTLVNNSINVIEQYCGSTGDLIFPNPPAYGLSINANSTGEVFVWSVNNYLSQGGIPINAPSAISTVRCNVISQTYYLNIDCYNNALATTLDGGTYTIQVYPLPPNDLSTLVTISNQNACNEPILNPINGCENYISMVPSNTNPTFPVAIDESGLANYTINFTPNPNGPPCCNLPTLGDEILENGDFELGNFKWYETEEFPPGTPATTPYGIVAISGNSTANMNGSNDAWFGGFNTNYLYVIEQNIIIPTCNTLSLQFDYKSINCVNPDNISLTVYINNTAVASLNCNNATNGGIATFGPANIATANIGTGEATIRFEAIETGTVGASLLIDNVSLRAKDCPAPIPCSQPIAVSYDCQDCATSLNLSGIDNTNIIYKAKDNISSTSTIKANVMYQAGASIGFDIGFDTNQNVDFDARIGGYD